MNVDQHLKVAQWHIDHARKHSSEESYKCGCPLNDHDEKAIKEIEEKLAKEQGK